MRRPVNSCWCFHINWSQTVTLPNQGGHLSWFAWDSRFYAYHLSIINESIPFSLVWTIVYVFPSSLGCYSVFVPSPRLPLTFQLSACTCKYLNLGLLFKGYFFLLTLFPQHTAFQRMHQFEVRKISLSHLPTFRNYRHQSLLNAKKGNVLWSGTGPTRSFRSLGNSPGNLVRPRLSNWTIHLALQVEKKPPNIWSCLQRRIFWNI